MRRDLLLAITEALAPGGPPTLSADERARVLRDTADFVLGQITALPWRLLLLFRIGLAVFALACRLRHLRGFAALPAEARARIVRGWAHGPVPLARQLFRPLRSTALLAFYEHPLLLAHLSAARDEARS